MMSKRRKTTPRKKTWKELPPMAKVGTMTAAVVQFSLLIAAQRDISRRPAEEIRGSKWLWSAVAFANFMGIGPIAYFAFGRKRA